MGNGKKPTEDEHFIPRSYFRHFSEINNSGEAFIWQFNLEKMQQTNVQVNVKTVCFEKNLYEIKHSDGTFVARNTIEELFGRIETNANRVTQSIITKSENENCLKCPAILSDDDKGYLIIFIVSLLFRDPATIESGIAFLQKSDPAICGREARNFTLMNLLPLGLVPEWDKNTIIRTAIEMLAGMAFQVGIADDDVIITSDRPVVVWPPKEDEPFNRPRAVVFPLSSKLLLYLFPLESVDPIARNCFVKLTEEQIHDHYRRVAVNARNWIYSRNPLTKEQLGMITKLK